MKSTASRRPNRSLVVAYGAWLLGGVVGAHRWYIGHRGMGLAYVALAAASLQGWETGIALFLFWVIDGVTLPIWVGAANQERRYIRTSTYDETLAPLPIVRHSATEKPRILGRRLIR